MGLPYGIAVLVIAVQANDSLLAAAGGLSCYLASLCFKMWKRSPLLCRGWTLAQFGLSGCTALWCLKSWQVGQGVASSLVRCWPYEPVLYLAAATCAFHLYVVFAGGNPPHKYDRLGVNFTPAEADLKEEYALGAGAHAGATRATERVRAALCRRAGAHSTALSMNILCTQIGWVCWVGSWLLCTFNRTRTADPSSLTLAIQPTTCFQTGKRSAAMRGGGSVTKINL